MKYTKALMEVLDLTPEDVVLTSGSEPCNDCDDCDDLGPCPRLY